MNETSSLFVVAVAAFAGGLTPAAGLGYWLATRFSNVYRRMEIYDKASSERLAEHEKEDVQRFGDLKLLIAENRIQAQTLEAVKASKAS